MPTLILECACGRRIKAPGATPGRVGRCPACGALIRVPDQSTEAADSPRHPPPTSARPVRAKPTPEPDATPDRVSPRATRPRPSADEPRVALATPPRTPERGILTSFLYPFWDTPGLITLVLLPLLLTAATVFVVFLYVLWAQPHLQALAFPILPFLLGCLALLIYTGQVIERYLLDSSRGEPLHPRWPELSLFAMFRDLFRWVALLAIAALAAGLPAFGLLTWKGGQVPGGDWVVAPPCLLLGILVFQAGWLATVLHDDLRAAMPGRLLLTLFRLGPHALPPAVLTLALGAALVLLWWIVARYAQGLVALLSLPFLWMLAVAAALVVARVLGLRYYHHRERLGWFPEREQWGVRG